MKKPIASVIVLNWNGRAYLEKCLDSLRDQTYSNFEIIVVDNGSIDGSVDMVTQRHEDIVALIKNDTNLGFAEGNNIGIRHSRGEYVVTLNNDTEVDKRWLEELISAAERNEQIGMCASKVLFLERPDVIDSAGMNIYFDGSSKQRGNLEIDTGQYDKIQETLAPSACAALYRMEMLKEIGLFDKDFFIYCEDMDLALRGRLAGWRAVFVPSSIVYHFYSGTVGGYSPMKAYLVERNHFWVAVKNFPISLLLFLPFFSLVRFVIQSYSILFIPAKKNIRQRKVHKYQIFKAILKAYISFAISIPVLLKKRKAVMETKKISDRQVFDWFRRFRLSLSNLILGR